MLGDVICEERGKVTGLRVLSHEGAGPKVEVSFQATGKMLGADESDMGTYVTVVRQHGNGVMYGRGDGALMTQGGEMVTWTGSGVGRFTGQGTGVRFRGVVYYQTASERFSPLNGLAGIYEYEADATGNVTLKVWEWK
ncbi:MAG TPA: hypothetical protein VJT33_03440 [bacterium]|nr:hypothetical protein [bacterium]